MYTGALARAINCNSCHQFWLLALPEMTARDLAEKRARPIQGLALSWTGRTALWWVSQWSLECMGMAGRYQAQDALKSWFPAPNFHASQFVFSCLGGRCDTGSKLGDATRLIIMFNWLIRKFYFQTWSISTCSTHEADTSWTLGYQIVSACESSRREHIHQMPPPKYDQFDFSRHSSDLTKPKSPSAVQSLKMLGAFEAGRISYVVQAALRSASSRRSWLHREKIKMWLRLIFS